ncbi:MAG: DUF1634 domain-containing protein [Desulfovibrio sp.]|uniref:DUF1634 domain-containing protein n=1 Tax=Desulfovibrio sp. TaxID=885 RepID=UPI00135D2BA4|nr:DUF1634 domain-containing protein [Desulfovibrio sp.]MTJ93372.1 DUF1634 domain-containing protein [Desulfovibrio sp.]
MTTDLKNDIKASPAQLRYADTLFYGALLGFVTMLITYALYVTGVLTPQIPLEEMPRLWSQSAAAYRAAGNIPQGWGWVALVGKGDLCNFIGIAFLAALTIFCFVQLAIGLLRQKQWIMAIIAILEVLVLSLAASGVLVAGGH